MAQTSLQRAARGCPRSGERRGERRLSEDGLRASQPRSPSVCPSPRTVIEALCLQEAA